MVDLKQLRVLIADDSDIVRQHLRDLLAAYAYTEVVGEAATTRDALLLAEAAEPDVVILDIAMPGSGIRALKAFKQQPAPPRVVMLTNHAGPYYRKVCLDAGADFFLDKSIEFDRIPEVLEEIGDDA